ncbi:FRG domain-containing protein [Fodinibius sediminis]|uniref:FRG domain-containing protein n=1 Tax=Fodinibius sediminis TaxID=1214077 RepID=A0A521FH49_9BACT|nr:FRG domain-containing protein [Fodinibius sediminis]SMO94981.1 FRG domain-containing protein [Fodinibius sediminis]
MRKIEKAFSHLNLQEKWNDKGSADWKYERDNKKILKSDPYLIATYKELVEAVAQISFYNQDYVLFFRGQDQDYKNSEDKTTILPTIYREREKNVSITERFEKFEEATKGVVKSFQQNPNKFAGTSDLIKYQELQWAIVQHYNIAETPVIDLTHSLHVAASFAQKDADDYGVIHVLGMPNFTNTISYYTNEEVAIIRLIAFGPPKASRLFMQEAYAAAPFPFSTLVNKTDINKFDFSRRLIAKFLIPNSEDFWGEGFTRLPDRLLLPEIDKIRDFLTPHLIDEDAFWDYFSNNS